MYPGEKSDVGCAWNDGSDNEWDYDMCEVSAINYDVSVQVVCDCQEPGNVRIDSNLSAQEDEADLMAAAVTESGLNEPEGEGESETAKASGWIFMLSTLIALFL